MTTQSGPRCRQRLRDGCGERAHGRGDEHHVGPVDRPGRVGGLPVDRPERERAGAHALVGVIPADLCVGARTGRQPDRSPDQAKSQDRDPQRVSTRGAAARAGPPSIRRC